MIEVSSSSGNMELSYNWCALLMIWLLIGIEMWVDIWYSLLLVGYSLFFVYDDEREISSSWGAIWHIHCE